MAKVAKEVDSNITVKIDASNTGKVSEFDGKKYYAAIKDKNGKYLVTNSSPTISSSKSWCKATLGAVSMSDDDKSNKGALIQIQCEKNSTFEQRDANVNVMYGTNPSSVSIKVIQSAAANTKPDSDPDNAPNQFHHPYDLGSSIIMVGPNYKPIQITHRLSDGSVTFSCESPSHLVRWGNDTDQDHYVVSFSSLMFEQYPIEFKQESVSEGPHVWPGTYFYIDFTDNIKTDTSWASLPTLIFNFSITYKPSVESEYSKIIDYQLKLVGTSESLSNSGTITATIKKNTDAGGVDITYELSADHLFNTEIGYINVNWLGSTGKTLSISYSSSIRQSYFKDNKYTKTYSYSEIPNGATKVSFTTNLNGFTLSPTGLTIPT